MPMWFHRLASPRYFYSLSRRLQPWIAFCFVIIVSYGLLGALWLAPADYQQSDAFRIIYVHVPAAVLSLTAYAVMFVATLLYFIWRIKLADVIAEAAAPIGASFTVMALATGMLWGKPMWGAWWVWDARLTSELILLFIYVGIMALRQAFHHQEAAARAAGIITIIGFIDIPIIHYSVNWWHSLHQGATVLKFAKPSIAASMLYPLLAMLLAYLLFFLLILLMRTRSLLLLREKGSHWVQQLAEIKQ